MEWIICPRTRIHGASGPDLASVHFVDGTPALGSDHPGAIVTFCDSSPMFYKHVYGAPIFVDAHKPAFGVVNDVSPSFVGHAMLA